MVGEEAIVYAAPTLLAAAGLKFFPTDQVAGGLYLGLALTLSFTVAKRWVGERERTEKRQR